MTTKTQTNSTNDLMIMEYLRDIKDDIKKLDNKIDAVHDKLDAKIEKFREELSAEIKSVRTELFTEIESVRNELSTKIESVRTELSTEIQDLKKDVKGLNDQKLSWSSIIVAMILAVNAAISFLIMKMRH